MANKKKYNFKGLDELFGESVTDLVDKIQTNNKVEKEIVVLTEINKLTPNPYQPRKTFDDEQINELVESIKLHGIIQPIIINNNNEIVAGERRARAAKLAGLKEVPTVTLKLTNLQMEEFAIIENIQRVDLLDIEEAVAYKKLATNLKLKQEEIAARVGKSRSHIANIMRLLNLPEKIQEAMMQKKITMGQAKPLLTILNNKNLLEEIYNKIITTNLSAREVENLIKNALTITSDKQITSATKSPEIIATENMIMRKLGTKVIIDNKKFTIHYSSDNDLNRILEILNLIQED